MSGKKGIGPDHERAGGKVSDEVAEEQAKDLDTLFEATLPEERARKWASPTFSRMNTEWGGEHRAMVQRIHATVDGVILQRFADAYRVMNDLYDVVREQDYDEATGVAKFDQWGHKVWRRSPTGSYYEDWSRLTTRQKEDFLFRITGDIFLWSQEAADLWGEAMFAKGIWQEAFSTAFDAPMSGTVEDRTAVGNIKSAEERYFAIFTSLLSRRADAIVRSLELLGQRIKDSLSL